MSRTIVNRPVTRARPSTSGVLAGPSDAGTVDEMQNFATKPRQKLGARSIAATQSRCSRGEGEAQNTELLLEKKPLAGIRLRSRYWATEMPNLEVQMRDLDREFEARNAVQAGIRETFCSHQFGLFASEGPGLENLR